MPVDPPPIVFRGGRSHQTADVPVLSPTWTPVPAGKTGKTGAVAPTFIILETYPNGIQINWSPAPDIGTTNEYELVVTDLLATPSETVLDTRVSASRHSYWLSGLKINTLYRVLINARADTGSPKFALGPIADGTTGGPAPVTGAVPPLFVVAVAPTSLSIRVVWARPVDVGNTGHWNVVVREDDDTGTIIENETVLLDNGSLEITSGLNASTTYWVGVRGVASGHGFSSFVSETLTTPASGGGGTPAAPKKAASITGSPKSVSFGGITNYYAALTWTLEDAPGVISGYRIERLVATRGNTDWLEVGEVIGDDQLVYNDWTVSQGVNYSYRVIVFGPGGESAPETTSATVNVPQFGAPKAPATVTPAVKTVTFGGITSYYAKVTWVLATSPGNINGYRIERLVATADNTDWQEVGEVIGASRLTYNDWTVVRGINYSYRVTAFGPGGDSPVTASTVTANIPQIPAPKAPASVTVSLGTLTFGGVTGYYGNVAWTLESEPGEITRWRIQRILSVQGNTNWQTVGEVSGASITNYQDFTVQRGVTYGYRVAAIGPGGISDYTAATTTAAVPAVPTPAAPKTPKTVTGVRKSVTFGGITSYYADIDWVLESSPGTITGFEIERTVAVQTPNWLPLTTVNSKDARSYNDWTVQRGVNYSYRVKAVGPGGTSAGKAQTGSVNIPAWTPPSAVTNLEASDG